MKRSLRNEKQKKFAPTFLNNMSMIMSSSDEKRDTYISIFVEERLGNQLFEIISMWSYAKKNNIKFVLDKSYQEKNPKYYRNFFSSLDYVDRLDNYVVKDCPLYKSIWDSNELYDLYNRYRRYGLNIVAKGFLQNANNFNAYREEILEKFFNIREVKEKNNKFFIHIRLTDFKTSPIHNLNLDRYYARAIEYVSSLINVNETIFYIMSDDIEEARKKSYLSKLNENNVNNIIFVDNREYDDIATLELCKECCQGAIIGHSTFGWWGAYIINCPEKIVVCPNKFLKSNENFSGFFLDYKVIDI